MKIALVVLMAFVMSACNAPSSDAEVTQDPAICDDSPGNVCANATWQLISNVQPFPARMLMTLGNGKVVFNSCTNAGMDRVTVNASRTLISVDKMSVPAAGKLSFTVSNLFNCYDNASVIFFQNNDVNFGIHDVGTTRFVSIDIDSP